MASEYYDNSPAGSRFTSGEVARGTDVDAKFDAVEAGFDKLPTEAETKQGKINYAADTGAADAYVVALPYAPASYAAGLEVKFKALNANTGASTINVDGLGVKAIVRPDGTALRAGDIPAAGMMTIRYDGTNFQIAASTAQMVTDAETAKTAAEAAQTAAETAQTGAETAETNAAASESAAASSASDADLERQYAAEWADKAEDSLITVAAGGDGATDYSALHHAAKASAQRVLAETARTGAELAEANTVAREGYAAEWANKAEDSLVSAAAGGDGIDDYSSLHHSAKANAQRVLAETARTGAELAETNAAASAGAASTAQTAAETAKTAAETAQTAAETAQTGAETAETNAGVSESAAASSASDADLERQYAAEWADKAEDALVSVAAGGDGSTDYSSRHHASKASASASAAATSESNAESSASAAATSETNAGLSESNAAASASAATAAKDIAASSANFIGAWSGQTGSAAIPTSVLHNGKYWQLISAVADITLAEPGVDAAWVAVSEVPYTIAVQPTLEMDFAHNDFKLLDQYGLEPKTLPQTVDVTRASTGTRTNALGRLETVPVDTARIDYDPVTGECLGLLVEESRTNLLTHSEQFDNAAWTKTNASISADAIAAPGGNTTADKLVEDTSTANHSVRNASGVSTGSVAVTLSCFVKAAERTEVRLELFEGSSIAQAEFDLTSGTLLSTDGTSANIEALPDDWYRVWLTATPSTGSSVLCFTYTQNARAMNYTGDGTSGIYIWGAQLEEGATPSSYIPSTETFISRASIATYYDASGVLQTAAVDEERLTYNPSNLMAPATQLFEESRTNLLLHSEAFDNPAWNKGGVTVTPNATAAPDGTTTAALLTEGSGSGGHNINQAISFTSGVTYVVSVAAKPDTRSNLTIALPDSAFASITRAGFNLVSGSVVTGGGATDAKVEFLPDGWAICSFIATATATSINNVTIAANYQLSTSYGYQGDGTSGLYLWGAQLEEGSYPTSYIPTTTTAVTRAADVYTSAASTRAADSVVRLLSGEYSQREGTVFIEFDSSEPDGLIVLYNDNSFQNRKPQVNINSLGHLNVVFTDSGGVIRSSTTPSILAASRNKAAVSFTDSGYIFAVNGAVIANVSADLSTIGTITHKYAGVYQTNTNHINGNIIKDAFYPRALSQTQLEALTR